jgi:hypothetical protein
VSDQRTGTCRVCGRMDVAVTQVPGHPGDVCVDEVACFVEFRRREGWDALGRLVDGPLSEAPTTQVLAERADRRTT